VHVDECVHARPQRFSWASSSQPGVCISGYGTCFHVGRHKETHCTHSDCQQNDRSNACAHAPTSTTKHKPCNDSPRALLPLLLPQLLQLFFLREGQQPQHHDSCWCAWRPPPHCRARRASRLLEQGSFMHSFAATLKSNPSGTSVWPAAWRCREGDTVTASRGRARHAAMSSALDRNSLPCKSPGSTAGWPVTSTVWPLISADSDSGSLTSTIAKVEQAEVPASLW
jgi:hypothetical protein